MKMMNAVESMTHIQEKAKELAVHEMRVVSKMDAGQCVRQGDVYIHMVADDHKHGAETKNHQLAEGDSQGSRHICETSDNITLYEGTDRPSWVDRRQPLGQMIKATATFTISHPEHADVTLPKGTYQICHQLDARTWERVRD